MLARCDGHHACSDARALCLHDLRFEAGSAFHEFRLVTLGYPDRVEAGGCMGKKHVPFPLGDAEPFMRDLHVPAGIFDWAFEGRAQEVDKQLVTATAAVERYSF